MVSSGAGAWIAKTMAQFKTWLGLGGAAYKDFDVSGGVAAYDTVNTHLSETAILIPKAGSSANTILLEIVLADKKKGSFLAGAANTGNMTINGKAFKKDASTQIPVGGVKVGKVYDFYYNLASDSVFILAKASGTAIASDVLASKTFSNDDGEQTGTMVDNGSVGTQNLVSQNAEYTIPAGYHNGLGKVKAVITNLIASVIRAGVTVGGIVGTFTSDATATAAQMLAGAKAYVNGALVTGTMPNMSLDPAYHAALNKSPYAGKLYLMPQAGYYDAGASAWIYMDEPNFTPANIPNGMSMFGLVGTNTNKKWASGTSTTYGTGWLSVTGLSFSPRLVLVQANPFWYLYFLEIDSTHSLRLGTVDLWQSANYTTNGFGLFINAGTDLPYTWYAYE